MADKTSQCQSLGCPWRILSFTWQIKHQNINIIYNMHTVNNINIIYVADKTSQYQYHLQYPYHLQYQYHLHDIYNVTISILRKKVINPFPPFPNNDEVTLPSWHNTVSHRAWTVQWGHFLHFKQKILLLRRKCIFLACWQKRNDVYNFYHWTTQI